MRPFRVLVLFAVVTAVVTGCTARPSNPVKIGSKNFTEELLVGEMYALLLEERGIPVQRRLNLGDTLVNHTALTKGEIDLYPEYTGTGYQAVLGIEDGEKDPAKVYQKAAEQYKAKWNLVWLDPAPMNDTNAIACSPQAAEEYGLRTLSDLSQAAPEIRFVGVADTEQRPDGLAGLRKLYGGFQFKSYNILDPGLKYKAITDGQADCAIAFSTDGQIASHKLALMVDDKGLWPPYQIAPVVRAETLQRYPHVRDALNKLAPLITTDAISDLNWRVDGDKQEYTAVARQFLQEKGLIK
jgi:osmoprotectant transport system substrate-binding protein